MRRRNFLKSVAIGAASVPILPVCCQKNNTNRLPNIVFIMADDLGYGEIQALNTRRGKIKTPGVDRLIKEGMTFTDAHSPSSVCTPTRYSLLTGRYSWRTRLQKGVLGGNGPCLIKKEVLTVAEMLKAKGYKTGMFGKWHLNWIDSEDGTFQEGPLDHGFNEFFGFHHSRTMERVAQNDRIIATRDPITMLPSIEKQSIGFINKHAKDARGGKPFFLYVPLSSPHAPVVPTPDWQGKSGLNEHADFVMQTDHTVKQIVGAIDAAGLRDNTLVIFTADNGTSGPKSKKEDLEKMGHFPSGELRGAKADIWDGGHRVPFVARWPARIAAGSKSSALMCFTDFMPTVAEIVGTRLPNNAGVDGFSFLNPLVGKKRKIARPPVVHHSYTGKFAIRDKEWKLVLAPGSGGWSTPGDKQAAIDGLPPLQLYNMKTDLAETNNLQDKQQATVKKLTAALEKIVADGRSTPGPKQHNDVAHIDISKQEIIPETQPSTQDKS